MASAAGQVLQSWPALRRQGAADMARSGDSRGTAAAAPNQPEGSTPAVHRPTPRRRSECARKPITDKAGQPDTDGKVLSGNQIEQNMNNTTDLLDEETASEELTRQLKEKNP